MAKTTEHIEGYSYGSPHLASSPVSVDELASLQLSVGFTEEDRSYLRMAGDVLSDQTSQVVTHWRNVIIAQIPNLARHSRSLDGDPLPQYLAKSNLRFEQWILDTCTRPYDRDWLNYQQEIATRHTSLKKNVTDGVESTPYVPLRDIITFVSVMNETIRPYLAAKRHAAEEVEKMHSAWCKSLQMQVAIWTRLYAENVPHEW